MITSLYECFQHWSDGGSIWLISDFHFNDDDCKKIDKYWVTPEQQIDIVNKKVFKNDTLICLGDVGDVTYIDKIKAHYKVLIMGNHDTGKSNYSDYFDEVYEGPLFISEKILLSHEPIDLSFVYNIHGHNHKGTCIYETNGCNLAANVCGYIPINLNNDIIKKGRMSKVNTIHRETINNQINKKAKRIIINNNVKKYNKVMEELKNK